MDPLAVAVLIGMTVAALYLIGGIAIALYRHARKPKLTPLPRAHLIACGMGRTMAKGRAGHKRRVGASPA